MIVEETFFRRSEVSREDRSLPAATYNLAHVLLSRAERDCLFVPIRSMQFLAVLDSEECIFVDREGGRFIEVSWRRFQPQTRANLADPVPFEAVYYSAQARALMLRLQGEFLRALRELEGRQLPGGAARVIPIGEGS